MRAIYGPTMAGAWILTVVLVATACHPNTSTPRSEGLARQLREVTLAAERDSLLQEVAANGRLLSDIQVELAKVEPKPARGTLESPALEVTKDQREFALTKVRQITTRLQAAETQLAASERRARRLTRSADSLSGENTQAKSTITDLTTVLETQRQTITTLTAQIEGLTTQNLVLADSVYHLTDAHNTAFYVVGTRAELLAQGVIVEDGHRAIPLIGHRGVRPARALPLSAFTSIDRTTTREIPLPHADRSYAIVSRQDPSFFASSVDSKGQIKGSLAIASPEEFWEQSRYLIVVER
jgi:hypothetical protein